MRIGDAKFKSCARCHRIGTRMFTWHDDHYLCAAIRECTQRMIQSETGRRPDRTWGPHWNGHQRTASS